MANVQTIKCPSCGAVLDSKEFIFGGTCPYCDSEVKVKPASIGEGVTTMIGVAADRYDKHVKKVEEERIKEEERRKYREEENQKMFTKMFLPITIAIIVLSIALVLAEYF